ncbi:GntR family transcriptional regulator [Pseudonocardia acidicola]|nr:GntR family transcriptional regulator [Pseudonocardia acidicola]
MMRADEHTNEPKYYLVKRHLLGLLAEFEPGAPLPAERELAKLLETSRSTVRQALSELVAEGRLERRHGSGTYVAEPKLAWPLEMASFTDQAAASGLELQTSLIAAERVWATPEISELLHIKVNAAVHRIERLRRVNGAPMALEQSHLSAARFPGLARLLRRSGSLYQVLSEQWGVAIVEAVETIETAPASPRESELLGTDTGAPMLVLTRHSFDESGAPVEWVRSWYRGDRYTFVARMSSRR